MRAPKDPSIGVLERGRRRGSFPAVTTQRWTLATVSVATFMLLLDISAVVTALPSIERDLGAGFTDLQWVVDAYTVTLAAFVLSAGSLADRLGRRRVFAAGLCVFSLASLMAGLASDPTFLNLARGLQGVGAAVMFAVSLAFIAQEFPAGRERGMAIGVYGATLGIAVAIGPLVGGALTEAFGWQAIFLVNVPVGLAAIAVTLTRLRESKRPDSPGVDWLGLITFSGALFLLVLALLRGNADGWGSAPIVASLVAAAGLLAAFVVVERRAKNPMLPLGLLRRPSFTGVQVAAIAVSASIFALFTYLTLYLQNLLHLSPVDAGLRLLPSTLPMFFVPIVVGLWFGRVAPRYLVAAGLTLTGAGLLWMTAVEPGSEWTALLGGLLLGGVGIGVLNPVIAELSVGVVPPEQAGMAAGVNDTARQAGLAIGVAAWGAVLLGRGADRAAELLGISGTSSDMPRRVVEAASTGGLDPDAGPVGAGIGEEAFVAGLDAALALGGVVALAGAIACAWLLREPAEASDADPRKAGANRKRPTEASDENADDGGDGARDPRRDGSRRHKRRRRRRPQVLHPRARGQRPVPGLRRSPLPLRPPRGRPLGRRAPRVPRRGRDPDGLRPLELVGAEPFQRLQGHQHGSGRGNAVQVPRLPRRPREAWRPARRRDRPDLQRLGSRRQLEGGSA